MAVLHAEVAFSAPNNCMANEISERTGSEVDLLSWSASITDEEEVVEEFTLGVNADGDSPDLANYESVHRLRNRRSDPECLNQLVEHLLKRPVSTVRVQDGDVHLHVLLEDQSDVGAVIDDLKRSFSGVRVSRLFQADEEDDDHVRIDLSALTSRQLEVFQAAYENGYFAYPRKANASEVSSQLGISRSTYSEHLAAAQSKIADAIFE